MDINETISKVTMEYLKPKYPVYEIIVIESTVDYHDEYENSTISTNKDTKIFMVDNEFNNSWGDANYKLDIRQYDNNMKKCSQKFIDICTEFKEQECSCYFEQVSKSWFILSIDRIA